MLMSRGSNDPHFNFWHNFVCFSTWRFVFLSSFICVCWIWRQLHVELLILINIWWMCCHQLNSNNNNRTTKKKSTKLCVSESAFILAKDELRIEWKGRQEKVTTRGGECHNGYWTTYFFGRKCGPAQQQMHRKQMAKPAPPYLCLLNGKIMNDKNNERFVMMST